VRKLACASLTKCLIKWPKEVYFHILGNFQLGDVGVGLVLLCEQGVVKVNSFGWFAKLDDLLSVCRFKLWKLLLSI